MIKKLEKAVSELEQRTNTKMRFCDYDDIQSGIQSMSSGNKYALWLYVKISQLSNKINSLFVQVSNSIRCKSVK